MRCNAVKAAATFIRKVNGADNMAKNEQTIIIYKCGGWLYI